MFIYRLASRQFAGRQQRGSPSLQRKMESCRNSSCLCIRNQIDDCPEVIVHYGAIPADYRIVEIGLPDGWPGEDSGLDTATYGTEWAACEPLSFVYTFGGNPRGAQLPDDSIRRSGHRAHRDRLRGSE
jgi:hypothetical protein